MKHNITNPKDDHGNGTIVKMTRLDIVPESNSDRQLLNDWKEDHFHIEKWMNQDGSITLLLYSDVKNLDCTNCIMKDNCDFAKIGRKCESFEETSD